MTTLESLGLWILPRMPRLARTAAVSWVTRSRTAGLGRRPYPRWVTLFLTYVCNARCEHCFYWADLNSGKEELTLGEYGKTFASMPWVVRTVRLSGGEPFARRDLADFYLLLDRLGRYRKLSVATNGMLECIKPLTRMLESGKGRTIINVSVSLDGLQPTHDRFRRVPGGFEKALRNLRAMLELAKGNPLLEVSVSTTITRANLGELPELIRLLKDDVGIRNHGFDFIRSVSTDLFEIDPAIVADFTPPTEKLAAGQAKAVDFLRLAAPSTTSDEFTPDERRAILERLEALLEPTHGNRLTLNRLELATRVKEQRRRLIPCVAGTGDCVIYPNGDVSVCEFTVPFANLRAFDFDFPALWESQDAQRMREKTRACACTHPCHLSDSMAFDAPSVLGLLER